MAKHNTPNRISDPHLVFRGRDGSTYLIRRSLVRDPENVTAEELNEAVDMSYNPQM